MQEGGKEALITALKLARNKPALSVATNTTCIACIILIEKTLG